MNLCTITLAMLATTTALTNAGGLSIYDNRADFNINTGPQTIEDFEAEQLAQIAMPSVFSSGLGANLFNGSVTSYIEAGDPDGYGFQNTTAGGRKYLRFGHNIPGAAGETGSYSVDFTFGQAVQAFGFDISGFQPQDGADGFNLTLFSNGQIVEDLFVPATQNGFDVEFFGFVADASFDTARVNIPVLNTNSTADYVAFDEVTWSTVPTPASASLLALGGLIATRRKR
ncbi:MAG: hypothetical protein CMJ25_17460 [Phycisphaerae bacterium]|nr:hypothetical protein [Phycisphaerae bacterium]